MRYNTGNAAVLETIPQMGQYMTRSVSILRVHLMEDNHAVSKTFLYTCTEMNESCFVVQGCPSLSCKPQHEVQ